METKDASIRDSREHGNISYVPPEALKEPYLITQASDVYSLGLILFDMLFPEATQEDREDGCTYAKGTSEEFKGILSAMLRPDPESRETIDWVMKTPQVRPYVP